MMHGTLNLYCLDCGEFVQWRRVRLYRADAYPDWRLEVFCRCGSETDERVLAQARAAYDLALDAELDNSHQNYFNSVLGRSGNLYFETLACGRPSSHAGEGRNEGGYGLPRIPADADGQAQPDRRILPEALGRSDQPS